MLTVSNVSKSFFDVRVLSDLSLTVGDGEVHALLGHNGSGKSTFIKVLSGYHPPDHGTGAVVVDGKPMRFGDTASSSDIGIRVVHQGLGLIPTLTVLENLRLGTGAYLTNRIGRIRWRQERAQARELLDSVGLSSVSVESTFGRLTAVE